MRSRNIKHGQDNARRRFHQRATRLGIGLRIATIDGNVRSSIVQIAAGVTGLAQLTVQTGAANHRFTKDARPVAGLHFDAHFAKGRLIGFGRDARRARRHAGGRYRFASRGRRAIENGREPLLPTNGLIDRAPVVQYLAIGKDVELTAPTAAAIQIVVGIGIVPPTDLAHVEG